MENLTTARISELRSFRDCPRKRILAYDYGFRPVVEKPYFAFGTAYHAAQAGQPWDLDPYEAARLRGILSQMPVREYDQKLVEVPFEMIAGRMLRLQGHIDAIVQYQGRYMVLERKTTSQELDADYFAALDMDHQVLGYYLGAQAMGLPVEGVLWEVVKKPALRPKKATPIENRKFKKDGTLYANQRDTDETPEEFQVRCAEAFNPLTDYALREVGVTHERIDGFKSDAAAQLRAIRDGAGWRNPQACPDCPYTGICARENLDTETPDGFIRQASSPEASPATTSGDIR